MGQAMEPWSLLNGCGVLRPSLAGHLVSSLPVAPADKRRCKGCSEERWVLIRKLAGAHAQRDVRLPKPGCQLQGLRHREGLVWNPSATLGVTGWAGSGRVGARHWLNEDTQGMSSLRV